eukprot:2161104-Rhodomonas_salina.2
MATSKKGGGSKIIKSRTKQENDGMHVQGFVACGNMQLKPFWVQIVSSWPCNGFGVTTTKNSTRTSSALMMSGRNAFILTGVHPHFPVNNLIYESVVARHRQHVTESIVLSAGFH